MDDHSVAGGQLVGTGLPAAVLLSSKLAASGDCYRYLAGFGTAFQSEAVAGALPRNINAPHPAPYGLYPESVTGTSFSCKRHQNARVWMYRIVPSVGDFEYRDLPASSAPHLVGGGWSQHRATPAPMRWAPLPIPSPTERTVDWVQSLTTLAGCGDPLTRNGLAVHQCVTARPRCARRLSACQR